MPEQIYSEAIFIGREKEIELFEQMLDSEAPTQWILNLYGGGGIGKTKLLYKYIDIIKERQKDGKNILVTEDLIDIYWTRHKRQLGILRSIADQLGGDQFESFNEAFVEYQALFDETNKEIDPIKVSSQREKLDRNFLESYQKLNKDRIVLLFDTAEQASDSIKEWWSNFLPKLNNEHHKTCVVIAGRKKIEDLSSDITRFHEISKFIPAEIKTYYEEQKINIPHNTVDRIAELSQGRPILIALTIDWIRDGHSSQELISWNADNFEPEMIKMVAKLQYPEDQIILAMAHLYRRFNEDILAYILNKTNDEAEKMINTLSRFSFVKYRPPVGERLGSCLLHDEMRRMVNKYIWTALDPLRDYRHDWDHKMVNYYEEKIREETNHAERWNLKFERLHYLLDVDLNEGFEYSRELFNDMMNHYRSDLMEYINDEVEQVKEKLSKNMELELEFRKAVIIHRNEEFEKAGDKFRELLKEVADTDSLLKSNISPFLVEAYAHHRTKEALKFGLESEKWFEDVLKKNIDSESPQYEDIERNFGLLCNAIGFAYRRQDKLEETSLYYQKALIYYEKYNDTYPQQANTQTNLAYVYHKLGRTEEAEAMCEIALTIRHKLNSPGQIGYTYNVRAQIRVDQMREREAISDFRRARDDFEKANNELGKAYVNLAHGRALRQLGRYQEKYTDEIFDPDREEYQGAEGMLSKAIEYFKKSKNSSYLSEALNEYGTLLRQQKKWDVAIKKLEESKKLSEEIGNQYRVLDNLVDLAILYNYKYEESRNKEDCEKALHLAEEASQTAFDVKNFYFYAKAEQVLANIKFSQKEYDAAFKSATNACIYIIEGKKPFSANKKDILYEDLERWIIKNLLLRLPSHDLVKIYSDKIIEQILERGEKSIEFEKVGSLMMSIRKCPKNYIFIQSGAN